LKEPLAAPGPLFVRIRLSQQHGLQHTLGRFKLSLQTGVEPATSLPEQVVKTLAVAPQERNGAQRQALLDYFSGLAPATKDLLAGLEALKKKEPPKPELTVRVLAQRTQDPRKTFVLKRGEFLDPVLDLEAAPAGFATLPPLKPREASGDADRLDLARWLAAPDNPLTPRVTVNHVWRLLFGAGIVRSASDFGVRGERPTHPELLDWLAAEFIGLGSPAASAARFPPSAAWSRKSLIKRIVMSATYRQASRHRPELIEADPQNIWLARQNRLRAEGEIVRDISLDAAGLLSRKIGGPSVFPPLPPGIAELSYAGNFKWTASTGADRYRRGMYTFFKRTAPHPNLTTFDCPDANLTCIERSSSNTPLQALTALNNEAFAEASRGLAKRMLSSAATEERDRLANGFRICVARPPHGAELDELAELLATSREWYRSRPEEAQQLVGSDIAAAAAPYENAAWIATSRVLINLDEFITRE
jgi:hypothetical protein